MAFEHFIYSISLIKNSDVIDDGMETNLLA